MKLSNDKNLTEAIKKRKAELEAKAKAQKGRTGGERT